MITLPFHNPDRRKATSNARASQSTSLTLNRRAPKLAAAVLAICLGATADLCNAGGDNDSGALRGIIDVHEHIVLPEAGTQSLIDVMDRRGIATMFLLDSPAVTFDSSAGFEGYDETASRQLAMKRRYPGRFRVFYTYPAYDADGPAKAERLAGQGIDGLKFYNGLPMLRDKLGTIDSPAMHAAYAIANAHGLPVIIHVEALQTVQRHELERVLSDFPRVNFICPHLCGVQSSLDILAAMLKAHPNLFTDGGPWHRVGAFVVKAPEKFRAFYIAHSDRLMFASDSVFEDSLGEHPAFDNILECERDLLETKYFSSFRSLGVMSGLYLPRAALEDIYFKTAARVFPPATISRAATPGSSPDTVQIRTPDYRNIQ
jgi:predicted TIM-barrel fold metal-dependent hydrolase